MKQQKKMSESSGGPAAPLVSSTESVPGPVAAVLDPGATRVAPAQPASASSRGPLPGGAGAEISATVRELSSLARAQGGLAHEDITESLAPSLISPENLQAIYAQLRDLGVAIEDATDAESIEHQRADDEERRKRLAVLDDPVRMYLNEVGLRRCLSRAEEVEIFRRIETAQTALRQALGRIGFAAREHLALARLLLADPSRERCERLLLPETLERLDDYLRGLPELIQSVHQIDEQADRQFAAFQTAPTQAEASELLGDCQRIGAVLAERLLAFGFKPKVLESMALVAAAARQKLLVSFHALITAENQRTRSLGGPVTANDLQRQVSAALHVAFARVQVLERIVRLPAKDYLRACAEVMSLSEQVDHARAEMVESSLRLVVSVAKRYAYGGVSLLDLIQEGNLALMEAVERFDFHRGFRFSTFAMWGIREAVSRAIANQGRLIRIPVHAGKTIKDLISAQRNLLLALGREPTDEELAGELKVPLKHIRANLRVAQPPVSLNAPVDDSGDATLGDFIQDEAAELPGETGGSGLLNDLLHGILSGLTAREREVLRLRFGLNDETPRTLDQIGQQLRISRERVRQIENGALRKMRHPSQMRKLHEFGGVGSPSLPAK